MTNAYFPLPFKLKGSNTGFHVELVGRLSLSYNPLLLKRHQEIQVISTSLFPFEAIYLDTHDDQVIIYPKETGRLLKLNSDLITKYKEECETLSHVELMKYYDLWN